MARDQKFETLATKFLQKRMATGSPTLARYQSIIDKKKQELDIVDTSDPYEKYAKYKIYQDDPIGFVENELGIKLWEKQKEMLRLLTKPPYRVFSCASHGVGKTFLAACATLWMGFCFPDSIVLTTAPTQTQVENLLWRTIRSINTIDQSIFTGKKASSYEFNKRWFGLGRTPSSGDAFQGFHAASGDQLIIIDEAVGVPQYVWEAIHGMDNDRTRILAICNPTDTTSYAYQEYISGQYYTIHISGTEHPNVINWYKGEPALYPGAIQGEHWFNLFRKWSDKVDDRFVKETDIEFPPESGDFYRPGALALSRLLGQWPIESGDSFFSELHVEKFFRTQMKENYYKTSDRRGSYVWDQEVQIGVDIARSGQDFSCISVRYKDEIVQHYRINGYDTIALVGFIEEIITDVSTLYETYEYDIALSIDATGLGVGVYDTLVARGYNAMDINFSGKPYDPDKYANIRTELYGNLAERCKNNEVFLNKQTVEEYGHLIRLQLMGAVYTYNRSGKYILVPKEKMRKDLGMSPDDTDSIALACYPFYNRLTVFVDDNFV